MAWVYLLLASLCEILWVTGMRITEGFSIRPWLSLGTFGISLVSFLLLALAMRTLPMGTSYAVWTGLGMVGAAIVGMVFFQEPSTLGRILCMALIVIGTIGLKLMTDH